ncbi:MAG: hypothetical protein K8R88_09880 [Armatimonadetes bacterium]|nr:hypothetical protein [Armatimonadota bacterium]
MTKSTAIPVVINGSHGEGGGALLRCALTVSCLTQQPVRVHNIRGSTRRAGLSSEDLTFLKILAQTCDAEVTGDELKGNDLTFAPTKPIKAVRARASVGEHEKGSVPGNALVILSSLLPVLARGNAYSKVIIEGESFRTRRFPRALSNEESQPWTKYANNMGFKLTSKPAKFLLRRRGYLSLSGQSLSAALVPPPQWGNGESAWSPS